MVCKGFKMMSEGNTFAHCPMCMRSYPNKITANVRQIDITPSVPLNFEDLGFLAGIKGCDNFNMTNQVTKKNLLTRRIQRYKGLLWGNHAINVKFDSPSLFLSAWKNVLYLT
jgi:hypothetical protein